MKFASANNLHRKYRKPDFLHAASARFACAAFCKESRMKFASANNLHRKYRKPDFLHAASAFCLHRRLRKCQIAHLTR